MRAPDQGILFLLLLHERLAWITNEVSSASAPKKEISHTTTLVNWRPWDDVDERQHVVHALDPCHHWCAYRYVWHCIMAVAL